VISARRTGPSSLPCFHEILWHTTLTISVRFRCNQDKMQQRRLPRVVTKMQEVSDALTGARNRRGIASGVMEKA